MIRKVFVYDIYKNGTEYSHSISSYDEELTLNEIKDVIKPDKNDLIKVEIQLINEEFGF